VPEAVEVTLFNKNAKPVAYIGEDGETVYTWDGRAVAYLDGDKLFGWNGKHLGWFDNGTVFDIFGLRSGFIRSKSPVATPAEPVKPGKHGKPVKAPRQLPVSRPTLCYGYSTKNLEDLLEEGKVS
jgi:hypothetical protein